MNRKRRTYSLDPRIIKALDELAQTHNMSASALLERLGFYYVVAVGKLPVDAKPLGEGRGGDRTHLPDKEEHD